MWLEMSPGRMKKATETVFLTDIFFFLNCCHNFTAFTSLSQVRQWNAYSDAIIPSYKSNLVLIE